MENSGTIGKRILIVEDEPAIGRICTRTMVKEGFEVQIAHDGGVAQEMIVSETYDLYLFDIRTPVVNGIELYESLEREHPEAAKKVIFTTGDVLSGDVGSFVRSTGRPFLPKPFIPEQLRAVVRQALNL